MPSVDGRGLRAHRVAFTRATENFYAGHRSGAKQETFQSTEEYLSGSPEVNFSEEWRERVHSDLRIRKHAGDDLQARTEQVPANHCQHRACTHRAETCTENSDPNSSLWRQPARHQHSKRETDSDDGPFQRTGDTG